MLQLKQCNVAVQGENVTTETGQYHVEITKGLCCGMSREVSALHCHCFNAPFLEPPYRD